MTLAGIEVVGYRSVRQLRFPLRQLTVLVGENGVGKTNLYRALELLQCAATGRIASEIAREGGLGSIFWAGGRNLSPDGSYDPKYRSRGYRKTEKERLMLEASLEDIGDGLAATYRIEVGRPIRMVSAAFESEGLIKEETVTLARPKKVTLLERSNGAVWARDASGARELVEENMLASETALAAFGPSRPELAAVRNALASWRFFHSLRSDADSPLRRPARAITSPLLDSDGGNLAAVFATLRHIRAETVDLDAAVEAAFPGSQLIVPQPEDFATFGMIFPEIPERTFAAHELSDGTLKFLGLLGAMLSYRLPPFIALNEPETSLHPRLLPALARTIAAAATRAQVWVVTHSTELAEAIANESGAVPREVVRTDEGTAIKGLTSLGVFDDE